MIDIGNTLWHADQKTGPKFLSQLSAALIRCERRYRTEVRSFLCFVGSVKWISSTVQKVTKTTIDRVCGLYSRD